MLAIVGVLLSSRSASFIEDIPVDEETHDYRQAIDHGFNAAAKNAYGAAGIYVGVLAFSVIQVWFNLKVAAMKQN
jgi:hypothetical protein